jgi:hypothetical protein
LGLSVTNWHGKCINHFNPQSEEEIMPKEIKKEVRAKKASEKTVVAKVAKPAAKKIVPRSLKCEVRVQTAEWWKRAQPKKKKISR